MYGMRARSLEGPSAIPFMQRMLLPSWIVAIHARAAFEPAGADESPPIYSPSYHIHKPAVSLNDRFHFMEDQPTCRNVDTP